MRLGEKTRFLTKLLLNHNRTQLDVMQKKYIKLKKRLGIKSDKKLKQENTISSSNPKTTIALQNGIHDRYFLQMDGQTSNVIIIFIK